MPQQQTKKLCVDGSVLGNSTNTNINTKTDTKTYNTVFFRNKGKRCAHTNTNTRKAMNSTSASSKSGMGKFWAWVKRGDSSKYTEVNRYIDRLIEQQKIPTISNEESWKKIKDVLEAEFNGFFLPMIKKSLEYSDVDGNPDRPDKILIELSFWVSQTINRIIKDNKLKMSVTVDSKTYYENQRKRVVTYEMQKTKKTHKIKLTDKEIGDPETVRKFMKNRVHDEPFKKLKEYPGMYVHQFKTDTYPYNMDNVTTEDIVDMFDIRTSGPDPTGIYYTILKDLDFLHPHLAQWFNVLLHKKHTWDIMKEAPSVNNLCKEWRHTFVFMQSKKTDPALLKTVTNYRPIGLMLIIVRSFNRLISRRTMAYLKGNKILNDELQKGIKGGFTGVCESVLISRELLKHSHDTQTPLAMCFLDIHNAYGSVRYPFLDYVMRLYEIPQNVRDYILGYYMYSTTHVYMGDKMTRPFEWRRGLFQGCSLSNCLFMMVMNVLFNHMNLKFGEEMGYKINNNSVFMTAYLDDLVLMTHSTQNLQVVLNELIKLFKWAGFTLNAKKTQFLEMNQAKSLPLYLNSKKIASISNKEFVYLGVTLNQNLDQKEAAEKLAKTVRDKFKYIDEMTVKLSKKEGVAGRSLPREDKIKLYTTHIVPVIRWQFINYIHNQTYRNIVEEVENEYLEKWTVQSHTDEKKEMIKKKINRRNELVDSHIKLMYHCSNDTRINNMNTAKYGKTTDEDIQKIRANVERLHSSNEKQKTEAVQLTSYVVHDINPFEDLEKGIGAIVNGGTDDTNSEHGSDLSELRRKYENHQFRTIDENISNFLPVLGEETGLNLSNGNGMNLEDGGEDYTDSNGDEIIPETSV